MKKWKELYDRQDKAFSSACILIYISGMLSMTLFLLAKGASNLPYNFIKYAICAAIYSVSLRSIIPRIRIAQLRIKEDDISIDAEGSIQCNYQGYRLKLNFKQCDPTLYDVDVIQIDTKADTAPNELKKIVYKDIINILKHNKPLENKLFQQESKRE